MSTKKKKVEAKPSIMRVPIGYSIGKQGLSQSLITTFQTCPRKFLYKVNGYRSASKSGTFLFGNIVHEALDKLYSGVAIQWNMFELNFQKNKPQIFEGIDPQQIETDFAMAEIVIDEYCKRYTDDFTEKKFVGVEEEFETEFQSVKLRGKKDGKCVIAGKKWLMEHKTKSRISEDSLMKKLAFDFQNLFYMTCDEIDNKEELAGVLYNVIRKPQLKQGKKTLAEFCQRVREDIQSRPDFYFMRWEVPYTKVDKKQFRKELEQKICTIEEVIADNFFYKCENACDGMFSCEYLDNCAADNFKGLTKTKDIFPELDNTNVPI